MSDRGRVAGFQEGDFSMFRRGDEQDAAWGGPSNQDSARGPLSGRIAPAGPGAGGGSGPFGAAGGPPSRVGGAGGFDPPQPPRGPMAAPAAVPGPSQRENNLFELKRKVQTALIAELDPKTDLSQTTQVRRQIDKLFNRIFRTAKHQPRATRPATPLRGHRRRDPRLRANRAAAQR